MGNKNAKENARVVPMSVVLNEQLAPDPTPHIGLAVVAGFDAMEAMLDQGVDAPADWTSVEAIDLSPVGEDEIEAVGNSTPTVVFPEARGSRTLAERRRNARIRGGKGKLARDPEHGGVTVRTVVRDGVIDDKPLPPDGVAVRLGVRESNHPRKASQAQVLGSKIPSERTEVEDGISAFDADLHVAEQPSKHLQGVGSSFAETVGEGDLGGEVGEVVVYRAEEVACTIGHLDAFTPPYDPLWRAESVKAAGINGIVAGDEALLGGVELPESLERLIAAEGAAADYAQDQDLFDYWTTARDLRG